MDVGRGERDAPVVADEQAARARALDELGVVRGEDHGHAAARVLDEQRREALPHPRVEPLLGLVEDEQLTGRTKPEASRKRRRWPEESADGSDRP